MKRAITWTAICCLGVASAAGAQVAREEAVRKAAFAYAKEQIKAMEGEDENWDLNFSARRSNTLKQPEGGYLFRFFIDLDGDGKQELFLSCTYQVDAQFGCWVYTPDDNGNFTLLAKDICMNSCKFNWSKESGKRELQVFSESTVRAKYSALNRYLIESGVKIIRREPLFWEDQEFVQQFGDDMEKFNETYHTGEEVKFDAEKITLADFLRDATAKWRPYNKTFSPRKQHCGEAEFDAIERSADFTFIKALEILGLEVPEYLRKQAAEAAPVPAADSNSSPVPDSGTQPAAKASKLNVN